MSRLGELNEAADRAYARARAAVYDVLTPGEPVELGRLSLYQQGTLIAQHDAEADLADFRAVEAHRMMLVSL